jgi:hypothetical protein
MEGAWCKYSPSIVQELHLLLLDITYRVGVEHSYDTSSSYMLRAFSSGRLGSRDSAEVQGSTDG